MRTLYTQVTKRRNWIIAAFLAASAVCLILQNFVSVNYDMNDYLPPDSPSTVALEVMKQEFEGGIPDARVMIRDVTIPQALEVKEQLQQIDGILEVTWLDDATDLLVPLGIIPNIVIIPDDV